MAHPFHPYLASLPQDPPCASCWPRELRDEYLAGTRLGALADKASNELSRLCARFLPAIIEAGLVPLFGPTSGSDRTNKCAGAGGEPSCAPGTRSVLEEVTDAVVWAYGMYESRHFLASLIGPGNVLFEQKLV